MFRSVLFAAFFFVVQLSHAAPAQVVEVYVPLDAYMDGLQNEGVQELPSLVVFRARNECLGIIDTGKPDTIGAEFNQISKDGEIKCSVKASKHFDKTGDAATPKAAYHLQLVLLESSICTLCPAYIDEVQKILDARSDVRAVVVRVTTQSKK